MTLTAFPPSSAAHQRGPATVSPRSTGAYPVPAAGLIVRLLLRHAPALTASAWVLGAPVHCPHFRDPLPTDHSTGKASS
jgi:hypothetical protein